MVLLSVSGRTRNEPQKKRSSALAYRVPEGGGKCVKAFFCTESFFSFRKSSAVENFSAFAIA